MKIAKNPQQYKTCMDAGACTAPDTGRNCNWGKAGRENHPVNCVDWNQAEEATCERAVMSPIVERYGLNPDFLPGCGTNSTYFRVAHRYAFRPGSRDVRIGFRPVGTVVPKKRR